MRLDHCGTDVAVSQQFLNRADVIAGFEQMGSRMKGAVSVAWLNAESLRRARCLVTPRWRTDSSNGAFGYFARNEPGRATAPRPAARSASCCAFTRLRCCASGAFRLVVSPSPDLCHHCRLESSARYDRSRVL